MEKINQVTPDEVAGVAASYLVEQTLNLAVIGNFPMDKDLKNC